MYIYINKNFTFSKKNSFYFLFFSFNSLISFLLFKNTSISFSDKKGLINTSPF